MSESNTGGPALCQTCKAPAHKKTRVCPKHYRFRQMRANSKVRGLGVPTTEWLEEQWRNGNQCPTCFRRMNLLGIDGQSTVVTIQHDRSGGMRLLCRSCNTRHAKRPGDTFYDIPLGMKVCPGCGHTLALEQFSTDNTRRWANRKTYCRKCAAAKMKNWRKKNHERETEKRRAYYHERARSGNPIPRRND